MIGCESFDIMWTIRGIALILGILSFLGIFTSNRGIAVIITLFWVGIFYITNLSIINRIYCLGG